MVKLNVGDTIDVSNAKTGTRSKDGSQWCMVEVKADKGYDKLVCWVVNPAEAQGRQRVEVVAINGVKVSNRQYTTKSGEQKWITEYNADITVKGAGAQRVQPQQQPNFDSYMKNSGFMDLGQVDDVNDPGLPFA